MLTNFENEDICLACKKPISLNKGDIGAMAPRLSLFICTICLIDLGTLEERYFEIYCALADEVVKLRKQLKKLEKKPQEYPLPKTMVLDDYRR